MIDMAGLDERDPAAPERINALIHERMHRQHRAKLIHGFRPAATLAQGFAEHQPRIHGIEQKRLLVHKRAELHDRLVPLALVVEHGAERIVPAAHPGSASRS